MRLAVALAAALAVLPSAPLAQGEAASPTPAPKADAGSAAPPKANAAPKADAGPSAPPKAEASPKAAAPSRSGSATKPPPPAANDLARALLTSEQWGKVLDSYASSLAAQVSQALLSKGEKVPEDLRGNLRSELEKTLPYQQTVQTQAEALARALTPDELKRTAAFYGSPLGRKVLDKLPEAQAEVAQELQGRLSTAVPEIVNRLAPKAVAGGPGAKTGSSPGTGSSDGADASPPGGAKGGGDGAAR